MTKDELLDVDVLLPYQQAWGRDDSEVKVWEKSRRIGASYAEAALSVLEAAKSKTAGGQSTHYLSYSKDMTRQFIADCATWAKALHAAAGELEEVILEDEEKDITVFRISFATGNEIWGLPSTPRVLRSKQGRVVLDEAAFVDDLDALIEAALALTIWGGSVAILSTHNGVDNEFNTLITDIREGRQDYSLHHTTIQDALDDGLYPRICLVKGREWSSAGEETFLAKLLKLYRDSPAQELYCIPSKSGSRYISRSLVESRMSADIPVLSYECDDEFTFLADDVRAADTDEWCREYLAPVLDAAPGKPAFVGMDFGRSGDLSVLASYIEEGGRTLRALCYIEMRNVPFAQQHQVFCTLVDGLKRFYSASLDARGNGQMIAELAVQRYGRGAVNQVMISQNFYLEYFPKYRSRLEDAELVLPKNEDIIDDHRTVVMENGIPKISERTGGQNARRHGDAVAAGLMAVHAYESGGGYQEYSYEAVKNDCRWRRGA